MSLYKIYEFASNLSLSGWGVIICILATLIEVTPIKVNPIGWLGRHLNADMNKRVDKLEEKLDEHIAQSYRTKILSFQDGLLVQGHKAYTQEQYAEVLLAITRYEIYCTENKIDNNKCALAVSYIERCYKKCQNERSFANLPTN